MSRTHSRRIPALAFCLASMFSLAAQAEEITLPMSDGGSLQAHWFPAPTNEARATVVALHGCGGLYQRDGKTLDSRYPDYVEFLHSRGYHVLLPDSLGSRGSGPLCSLKYRDRKVNFEMRRNDVIDAVNWAARQPQVDAKRIALLGWSHGAMTTLTAIDSSRPDAPAIAGAAMFYPGCSAISKRNDYRVEVPTLMMLGAKDDWTAPASCEKLAKRLANEDPAREFRLVVYPDSVHAFDSKNPVRARSDVPNGVDKSGVHVGGNPVAREASRAELDLFLQRIFKP
ncbi:MAG: alpha/beta fold hydrolase [Burkholderiaceae bacterium]